MIDPTKITNFNLNRQQLEEMAIFWVMVAGKKAKTTARLLEDLLTRLHDIYKCPFEPFQVIRTYDAEAPGWGLEYILKSCGFGCQKSKAKSLRQLASSGLDLKTCTVDELESIHGIGMKTSRCFVMHTRKDARHAGLDTHVLKWLRYLGYDAPKATPSKKQYLEFERIFVQIADLLGIPPAVLDLDIWNAYSAGGVYTMDAGLLNLLPRKAA